MPSHLRQRIYALLRITGITLAALFFVLFALVQFQQHLLRHRAEELNADIAWLRDHPGTWTDLQRIQQRWGAFAHYDGSCTPHHCDYIIQLSDLYSSTELNRHVYIPLLLFPPYQWLGGHPTRVQAELRMTEGHLWGANLFVHIMVFTPFDSFNYGYDLDPKVYFGPRLFTAVFEHHIDPAIAQKGYWIGRPSGCEGCISQWVSLTPSTSKADRERLSVIDFSCITRFRQCRDIPDIFPGVAAQEKIDGSAAQRVNIGASFAYDNPSCAIPVKLHATESANILAVDFLNFGKSLSYGAMEETAFAKIVEKLKNADAYTVGQSISVHEGVGASPLPPGHYLLFFNNDNMEKPAGVSPPSCSIIFDTPTVRSDVAQGIANDFSIGEQYRGMSW